MKALITQYKKRLIRSFTFTNVHVETCQRNWKEEKKKK